MMFPHPNVALLAFFQGTQLSLFERFLTQAISGINSTSITAGMQNAAYVVLLVGFLWQMYQAALHGGDVRGLGTSLIKYIVTALVVMNYSAIFTTVNTGFVNAGNWVGNASGFGNLLDNWKTDLQTQFNQAGSQKLWGLVTGDIPGLIDAILIIVAYLLYPFVIAIFGFFYIFYGSVLYIFGPIVIALMPLGATNRIAKAYVENLFIWNSWPILYGGFGALLGAVQMGQISQMLNQNNFLGGLGNLEGSILIGIASIIYSLAIAVIPFIAKRIVSGDVGSTASALIGAAVTALTVGAAGVEGAVAGATAAGTGGSGSGAGGSAAATSTGKGGSGVAGAGSNQPARPQGSPRSAAESPADQGFGGFGAGPTIEGHAEQMRSSMSDVLGANDTNGEAEGAAESGAPGTIAASTGSGGSSGHAGGGGRSSQGETVHVNLQLAVAAVQSDVQVNGDSGVDSGGVTMTLNTEAVQGLADDPDDFLRELQVLASEAGGDPTMAMIMVDGFQNPSALPPKNSIASIRINPDLFSAKYRYPPFFGGVIEITTKPGADAFHGAAFFTDSDGIFNATDPFSVTATPAGRRRYGFELSGPIFSKKSGFALALEKRDIDEFNVVNAVTLDANGGLGPNGNGVPSQQTVSAPQRLWIASARGDWQVTSSNVASLSFSANVNNEGNQGVGGLTLAVAGYSSLVSEYDLRFHDTHTISPNILHDTHIGYSWKRTEQAPLSNTPSVQVAGYFLGGGAISQNLNDRERDLEVDEDMTVVHGKHTLAFGAQSFGIFVHDYDPDTFNGAYVFGGGSAPMLDANNNPTGQTTTISALEQYRRALLNLPGGSPTTYQVTTGKPLVPLTQWQVNLYVQDTLKLTQHWSLDTGFRYSLQTTPGSFANYNPRLGLAWAPGKKQTWVFHARAGFFSSPISQADATDVYRLNGILQRQTTVYSPSYNDPLTPVSGSVQVATTNLFSPTLVQSKVFNCFVNIEHEFAHQWHASGNFFCGGAYGLIRTVNLNAPLVASSVGIAPDPTAALLAPRPIAPGENLIEYQNSGHISGNAAWFTLGQHSYKRFGMSARYLWRNMKSDTLSNPTPQSSYSKQGESARRYNWSRNSFTLSGNLNLPYRIEVTTQFDFSNGVPYNITTGTDNNGDGNFTDRPSYASAPGPGVYSTRFGLLTTNTVNGNVPADLGTMPGVVHLDMNLSRAFTLNPKDKNHPRTLTFSARSANLLNHTNVTAVNTILSSGTVGQPVAAETARRVELGVRFAF